MPLGGRSLPDDSQRGPMCQLEAESRGGAAVRLPMAETGLLDDQGGRDVGDAGRAGQRHDVLQLAGQDVQHAAHPDLAVHG